MSGHRAKTVGGALVAAVLLLGLTALAARVVDRPIDYFLRDPAALTGQPGYIGGISSFGVLLSWGAGVSCVLAGALRKVGALLAVGALMCVLACDDLFLVHESMEAVAFAGYGAAVLAIGIRYREYFAERDWPLLALALGFLAFSVGADFINEALEVESYVLEDALKLLGIAALSTYLVILAVEALNEGLEHGYRHSPEPASLNEPPGIGTNLQS